MGQVAGWVAVGSVLLGVACRSPAGDRDASTPADLAGTDLQAVDPSPADGTADVPPPPECRADGDCSLAALMQRGRVEPGTCRWDADCPVPQGCHPVTHRCETACQGPAWCDPGRECLEGYCADRWACDCQGRCIPALCRTNDGCASDRFCDPCTKACEPRGPACAPCGADDQCLGDSSRCVASVELDGRVVDLPAPACAPWCPLSTGICAVDGATAGSYVCARAAGPDQGVCVPATLDCGKVEPPCGSDLDCPDPDRPKCWPDRGACGCRDALSCAFGQVCHPVTHRCVAGCADDAECGEKRVCAAGLCRDACVVEADDRITGCDDPPPVEGREWDCDAAGHCFVPGMCFGPKDCPEAETHCDAESRECRPGCLLDFDCKTTSKICDGASGRCLDRPCSGNFECACGNVCDLAGRTCRVAEGNYCAPCDQQQGDTACGSADVLCIGLSDEDGNDRGSWCLPPCGPDPANPCPQGWTCEEIQDTEGKSHGRKCFRYCYATIEGCAIGNPPPPANGGSP